MNYFIFGFSALISLVCGWFSFKMIRLYFKVRAWQRVSATILSKEIIVHEKYSSTNSPYGLKVNYSYKINNSEYCGDKVYLVELTGGQVDHMKNTAEKKINQLEQQMKIYVNPQHPDESVIYCKGIGLYIFVLAVGLFTLLLGLSYLPG